MKIRDLPDLFLQPFVILATKFRLFQIGHRDIESLYFLIFFPGQKYRRMFPGRIRSAATTGIAADSPDLTGTPFLSPTGSERGS